MTLRREISLPGGRQADVRRSLEEIEAAGTDDPVLPREAFPPVKAGGEEAPLTANLNRLLAALKAKRLERAREQKQPAFVIFHDKVLVEMARRRPATEQDLLSIPGIGPAKAALHGAVFLAVIAKFDGDS